MGRKIIVGASSGAEGEKKSLSSEVSVKKRWGVFNKSLFGKKRAQVDKRKKLRRSGACERDK